MSDIFRCVYEGPHLGTETTPYNIENMDSDGAIVVPAQRRRTPESPESLLDEGGGSLVVLRRRWLFPAQSSNPFLNRVTGDWRTAW